MIDPDRLSEAPQAAWVCSNCGEYAIGDRCACGWVPPLVLGDLDDVIESTDLVAEPTDLYMPEIETTK